MEEKSNVHRLHAAGIVTTTELPEPYRTVIEELSDDEINAIVSAKMQLDDAYENSKSAGEKPLAPHYGTFFVPF